MKSTLVHVGVRATDLEKTLGFWRDALGLEVAATMPGCCDLTDGYHNFRVFQHAGPPRPPHVGGLLDYLHIGIRVPDLSAAAKRCEALGYRIIWDGVDAGKPYDPNDPPARSFKVEDPDGIVVDVTADPEQWPGTGL
jgi:catechol 2,3-dioxygenase-like lactoylglutathione lyase family enzyme